MRAEWGTHVREDRWKKMVFVRKPEGKKPLPRSKSQMAYPRRIQER